MNTKQVVRQDEKLFVPMCVNASPCSQAGVVFTAGRVSRNAGNTAVRQAGAVRLAPFRDSPFHDRPPAIPRRQIGGTPEICVLGCVSIANYH